MPGTTSNGYPYPLETEPVALGAKAIQNLAEELPPALILQQNSSAGSNVSTSASTGAFFIDFPNAFKSGTFPMVHIVSLSPNSGGFNFQLDSAGISGGVSNTRARYLARRSDGSLQLGTTIAVRWWAIGVRA